MLNSPQCEQEIYGNTQTDCTVQTVRQRYQKFAEQQKKLQEQKTFMEIDLDHYEHNPEWYEDEQITQIRERNTHVCAELDVITKEIDTLIDSDSALRAQLEREHTESTSDCQAVDIAVITRLTDVAPSRVQWLWPRRIPLGKMTILDGDPDSGKSLLSTDIGAWTSTGRPMPYHPASDVSGPSGVVLLSAEDDLSDTIRPRLEAARADLTRIVALERVRGTDDRLPTLADLEAIRRAIATVDAKLVIIDPLMAYLPSRVDSHKDQDIRSSLAPLAALAAKTGAAVLVIRHLNKTSGGNPLYRGGGSIGIIGAARSGLLLAKDPEDPDGGRRILASTKSNLAKPPPALAYRIETTAAGVPYIIWEGTTHHTATSLLAQNVDGEERPALEEAQVFLFEALSKGPQPAREVQQEALRAGIAERTLRRARQALSIKPAKTGRPGAKEQQWTWSLPPKMAKPVEDDQEKSVAPFGGDGPLRGQEQQSRDAEVIE